MQPTPARLDALTGLRFVAAALVFASHLKAALHLDRWNLGTLGSSAVGFFFVLSGFILAHVYREQRQTLAAGGFYLARFARIWPTHLVCLLLMLPWTSLDAGSEPARYTWRLLDHLALLQAWTTESSWAQAFNGPAWSLSVEAFFYAVFPFLIRVSSRSLLLLYAACWICNLALYAEADALAASDPSRHVALLVVATTSPVARLPEFLLGILVQDLWQRQPANRRSERRRAVPTLLELAACAWVAASFAAFSGNSITGNAWIDSPERQGTITALAHGPGLSFAFAALVYCCANGHGLISSWLASSPMRYLGEISYSLYLVHSAVILVTTSHMGVIALPWKQHAVYTVCATLAASAILHATVELPVRQALLARGASWPARLRIHLDGMARSCKSRAFLCALGIGTLSCAWIDSRPASLIESAHNIASHGSPDLHDIRFGDGCTLVGAMTWSEFPSFQVWLAVRETPGSRCEARLEARSRDNSLVHRFACETQQSTDADGSVWSVIHASAHLARLAGSVSLALTMIGPDGTTIRPQSEPPGADGASVELYRLPW